MKGYLSIIERNEEQGTISREGETVVVWHGRGKFRHIDDEWRSGIQVISIPVSCSGVLFTICKLKFNNNLLMYIK